MRAVAFDLNTLNTFIPRKAFFLNVFNVLIPKLCILRVEKQSGNPKSGGIFVFNVFHVFNVFDVLFLMFSNI